MGVILLDFGGDVEGFSVFIGHIEVLFKKLGH